MADRDPRTDLARLTASVLKSARYRHLCPEVVERIGTIELVKRKTWREAENETRKHLHRIGGSYLDAVPPYAQWLATLQSVSDPEEFRSHLRRMMLCHASTRERLPILDDFYRRILEPIRPVRSIVDIGCGFNPLALPWMNLDGEVWYEGYDIYLDMTDFLESAMDALPDRPKARVNTFSRDVSPAPPSTAADLALVLKYLPLLEHKSAEETVDWLRLLNARYAVVSFPTRTLGGRNVGMAQSYDARFSAVLDCLQHRFERIEFTNELCFIVELAS